MKDDIYRDPNESQGLRVGLGLCGGGVCLLALGFVIPELRELSAGGGNVEPSAATSTAAWLAQLIGWLFLALGGLALLMWDPFRALQQKYGTIGACLIVTPGFLLAAGIFAMALG